MKFNSPGADCAAMAGVPRQLRRAEEIYGEQAGVDGFNQEADRHRPLQARRVSAQSPHRARAQRRILGTEAGDQARDHFQIIKDPSARVAAIQSGQADLTINVPVREASRLQNGAGFAAELDPITRVILLQCAQRSRVSPTKMCGLPRIMPSTRRRCRRRSTAAPPCRCRCWRRPERPAICPTSNSPTTRNWPSSCLAKSGFGPDKPAKIGFAATNGQFPERLRHRPRHRADVEEGRHRRRSADHRIRQIFRAQSRQQVAGSDALQLGQCHRRSGNFRRLSAQSENAVLGLEGQGGRRQGARPVQRRRLRQAHRRLQATRTNTRSRTARPCRCCKACRRSCARRTSPTPNTATAGCCRRR